MDEFKSKIFHKVKSFKNSILNTTPKNTRNQEHIITSLLDNITFLKYQLRQREKVADLIISHFWQENVYLFQKRHADNQLERNAENVKSKENVKLKETEKINHCSKQKQNGKHWRKEKQIRLWNKPQ